ncbi:uncharacterized protein EI90DRAFT_3043417 [Cantharellus anzutake]|uniref:uncharacterized protein n=1 Tax=Cantharellus anzutake TaxID=1750568 RepID=UPI0019080146|nr:uncharacterized protein EI90DRAFT_3043417 [Cantharellus anzutake]KAF8337577.1 hypothetical protein EI90DRAFT_3043417 [Cantharellus anzutake]
MQLLGLRAFGLRSISGLLLLWEWLKCRGELVLPLQERMINLGGLYQAGQSAPRAVRHVPHLDATYPTNMILWLPQHMHMRLRTGCV